jgi:hypothetical protein
MYTIQRRIGFFVDEEANSAFKLSIRRRHSRRT